MKTKAGFSNQSWEAHNKLDPAQWIILTRIGLLVFILAGVGSTALAQSFHNLDFEQASLIPLSGDRYGRVQFGPALPGWTGYCGTNAQTAANYNNEFLDSAGISILETSFFTNGYTPPPAGFIHGRFCSLIQSGHDLSLMIGPVVETSIAQTGIVPSDAQSIILNAGYFSGTELVVTFNGIPIPMAALSGQSGYMVLSGDVSQFAGQTGELRFTRTFSWYTEPNGATYPRYGALLLDYIRFSNSPSPPLAPTIQTPPQSQAAPLGSTVDFVADAAGWQPLAYQWSFGGTNAISGATSSRLHLADVQLSQSGAYTVVVTNGFGAITSAPAILTVIAIPPRLETAPRSQTNIVGGIVEFTVGADGSPPLSYQWFFNGGRISDATSTNLYLLNLQLTQSGAYTVVVTNAFGAVTSSPALLTVIAAPPPIYIVLHNFSGNDGWGPWGNLASSGTTLYGTTRYSTYCGTVFKVNMEGSGYAILHNFALSDGPDPTGALALSSAKLYGTTLTKAFKIDTDGSGFTILKDFSALGNSYLHGDLVLSGTTLYGTTRYGGSGHGTVFKVNTDGSGFTVLHNFTGYPTDGRAPDGSLLLTGTTLYGATPLGGSYAPFGGTEGCGTLFKIQTDGGGYTIVKQFTGTDGTGPYGGLLLSGTTLYGTTEGGYYGGYGGGKVFKINTDGSGYTVLHDFTGPPSDGALPFGGLVSFGTTLYGTTSAGGSSDDGTVFKVNTDGSGYSVLKQFSGNDGQDPQAGLLLGGTTLYGTTSSGGISNKGVVFALSLSVLNILTTPTSQTAEMGSSATFAVRAEGDPSTTFQWFFNRTNVISGARTNSSLHLTNIQPSQAGAYTVIAANAFGAATSAPAILSVIPAVERRMVPALTLMGQPGSSLNLQDTDALEPSPSWVTFDNVALTNTLQSYFDLSAPLAPQRFYRAWQPGPTSVAPALDLHLVPALTLTGAVGSAVRVDYINQFGPTDAWVTLATVTLTNTSQLYFDASAIGQPPRLWRLVPVP